MTVLNPNNTQHEFNVMCRTLDSVNIDLVLYNEDTREETTLTTDALLNNEVLNIIIDLECTEGQVFSFKLVNDIDEVIYRGKFFVTSQTSQEYKING